MAKRGKYGKNACQRCTKLKVRCEDTTPCWRCEKAHRPCERRKKRRNIRVISEIEPISPSRSHPVHSEHALGTLVGHIDEARPPEEEPSGAGLDDGNHSSDDDWEVENLCTPGQNLYVEYDELHHYGAPALFFRLLSRTQTSPVHPRRAAKKEISMKKHVLLISGNVEVDAMMGRSQCECWEHCWSRHLPGFDEVPLTRQEHDKIMSLLFSNFACWCMRVIPELLLRDMHRVLHARSSETLPKTAHYSPFLHNSLLAVATAFSDDPRVSNMTARQVFAKKAKDYIEPECERPSLSAVQALSLLASFYSGQGQQTIGFMYFGMSARLGQALGLGSDHTQWIKTGFVTTQDIFDRRWCHQMTCVQDACWSLYVGREFTTLLADIDKELLSHPFARSLDAEPFQYAPTDHHNERIPSQIFSNFSATCELMQISRRIMTVMSLLSRNDKESDVKSLVQEIDDELILWESKLPTPLRISTSSDETTPPYKLMLHLAYWWQVISLLRPFCSPQSEGNVDMLSSINRCTAAADIMMNLIQIWRTKHTLRVTPITFMPAVFSAGTVYLLNAAQDPAKRKASSSNVRVLIDVLRETAQSWQCASKMADIFENMLKERRNKVPRSRRNLRGDFAAGSKCPAGESDYSGSHPNGVNDTYHLPPNSTNARPTLYTPPNGAVITPEAYTNHVSTDSLFPPAVDPVLQDLFPWYGSMGLSMLDGDTFSWQPNMLDPDAFQRFYAHMRFSDHNLA
ncbi:hypothetical protein BD410DRAFT_796511 [Rickenella mellea]|uniref:Zn(2)-C6 fungal-type domain-containing protein n=1 Tax=Rickenella mellea TaxID=50990 RepID=A0A4Y7PIT3_9AGAM|nr:hypothetical protein BD410DRAFT_796511 [Rickenella mellea]